MKSNSRREPRFPSIIAGCLPILVVFLFAAPLPVGSASASAVPSISAMARLRASPPKERGEILSLFDGYVSLGLREEAGRYLEQEVRLGQMTREDAAPLFEKIALEQSRWDEPSGLVSICEMALRSGVRTSRILYSYGTGLRLAGRLSDARAILSEIPAGDPLHSFALFSIGQIAADEGDAKTAMDHFARVRLLVKDRPQQDDLEQRVALSQAELFLVTGRPAEAVPLMEAALRRSKDPFLRIGMAAARGEALSEESALHAEMKAGMSPREGVLFSLLLGGLARERGDYESAVAHMTRAGEDIKSALLSGTPPASARLERYKSQELLERLISVHSVLREQLAVAGRGQNTKEIREGMVNLLLGILLMDHAISRSIGAMPAAPNFPPVPSPSSRQIEEVFLKIEQVTLGGETVDGLVNEIGEKIDILQNIGHPMQRYRHLTQLMMRQKETVGIKEAIRKRRAAAIAGVTTGEDDGSSRFLGDIGRFLEELESIREIASDARGFMRHNFGLLKEGEGREKTVSRESPGTVADVLAFDNERFSSLLPSVQALEKRARIASWERQRQEILLLRPVVFRQLADTLVAQAFSLRAEQPPGWSSRARALLDKAVSYLSEKEIPPDDKADIAANIGSSLLQGKGGREPHPGSPPGQADREIIAKILPWLKDGGASGGEREKRLYVRASLKMAVGSSDALPAAREFLAEFPSSPLAGDLAVRLGNNAILAGKLVEAEEFYKTAARIARPDSSSIARYMLGWFRYHKGDSEGAVEELASSLSDPSFSCRKLEPFEKSVLTLAARAWMDLPPERLGAYPPVEEGGCGGKLLLSSLGEAEEKRGETSRAAVVFDVLAGRFTGDEAALTYEMKSVEDLIRAGKEDEAYSRALKLNEKYGPGTAWANSHPPAAQKAAHEKLAGLLKTLSERKFEEGVLSGKRSTMAEAASGMEQYFSVKGEQSPGSRAELRLKYAIAALKSGDRETGIGLLETLLEEKPTGPIGEKAAVLYADTMIAGYERKEQKAEDAEKASLLLLDRFPSEKNVSLAYRAAADLLAAGEYERAKRVAGRIESDKSTPAALLPKAMLVQAESDVFLDEPASARGKADQILAFEKGKGVDPAVWEKARDLFLLSSLKEVEAKTTARDYVGAARLLEALTARFPDAPEAPGYSLRAVRLYREGGDLEGMERVASVFRLRYPRREEGVEIAGILGAYLEERKEFLKAADVYAEVADRFSKDAAAGRFLFQSALLARDHGDLKKARIRFSSYRDRYPQPRWKNAYASLSVGLFDWGKGNVKTALRGMEEGIRQVEAGVEADAPRELFEVEGKAQIAIGEYWADQFRSLKLTAPLEKNLAIKDRFFRRSLQAYAKAEQKAPLEVALNASELSGDLLVEFGKAILASQRPKGMNEEERARYEAALAGRARPFFERSLDWYVGAIDRLEAERGPSDLALPIRQRLEEAQRLLAQIPGERGAE